MTLSLTIRIRPPPSFAARPEAAAPDTGVRHPMNHNTT